MTDYQLNVLEEIRDDCNVCMEALTVLVPRAANKKTEDNVYNFILRKCEDMKHKLYDWLEDDNDDELVRIRYKTLKYINSVIECAVSLRDL